MDEIVDYPFIRTGEANARPALFIRLFREGTNLFQDTTGLIDSGASDCCVPIGYGEILGLNPHSGKERTVRTAKGKSKAYEHTCSIKVWDTSEFFDNKKVVAYEVPNLRILFMPDLTDVLLGVSFVDGKVLTIDYSKQVFSLRAPV